jgi:ketosteroid isomerase-like protein
VPEAAQAILTAMGDSDIELVRHAYEVWNASGLGALEPWLADAVELHDAPEMPDAGVSRGRESVRARLEEVAQALGGGWVELGRFRAFGDQVLVSMVWQAEADGSTKFGSVFHLVRVADGRIAGIRVFLSEDAALAALEEAGDF